MQYSLIVKIATLQTISYSLYSFLGYDNKNKSRIGSRTSELEKSASLGLQALAIGQLVRKVPKTLYQSAVNCVQKCF